jgi:hypothetical protein
MRGYPEENPNVYVPARQALRSLWAASPGSWEEQQAIQTLDGLLKIYLHDTHLRQLYGAMDAQRVGKDIRQPWYHIDPNLIEWEEYTWESHVNYEPFIIHNVGKKPQPGQEWKFYREANLMRFIETEIPPMRTPFLSCINELKEVCQALAANPILVDSGEEEVIYRPGAVRPYQDIKNDIANQLSGLPSFTARIKIGSNATQNPGKKCLNCGKQSKSGALYCGGCGTKLPAQNEYTLTTIKPAGGIGAQQLQQRIKAIQTRNLREGYVRERVKVEAEILQRQTGCSSGAVPAQPQPQQPSPQPQARHARQVAVKGNCPKCGAANSSNAKFCNQCGTKL